MPDTPDSRDAESVERRLARLLDTAPLARIVPHLAPELLHRVIVHRGLDACTELVASATPAQLTTLLDLDLWVSDRPGLDEQLDVARFGEWIEVLVNDDEGTAARTIAAMDRQLAIAGLSRYIRVCDPAALAADLSTGDEPSDVTAGTTADPGREIGGYVVRARRTDAWDAIVSLLMTLADSDAECFDALMSGCRARSNDGWELDGLDDLLLGPEQQQLDVTLDREGRRAIQGYVTPADARAFLKAARQSMGVRTRSAPEANAVAAPYLRESAGPAPIPDVASAPAHLLNAPPPTDPDDAAAVRDIVELLAEAGLVPEQSRALLEAPDRPDTARLPALRSLMSELHRSNPASYLERSRELAFLANTLVAGCSVQQRAFTPREASDAAACTCNLGLELRPDAGPNLLRAFEAGWTALHEQVSLGAADRLLEILAELAAGDTETQSSVQDLRRLLSRERAAGTPWRARDALDVIAILDTTAWAALLGLLDECPVLPAALRALLDKRTAAVSATAFEFIASVDQIAAIRRFLATLGALLAR